MTFNTEAIVLKSYSWPRQARLYILYSKRFGKIKAVVRGAEKVTSKIAGHLSPFTVSEVMIAKGKSIDTLAQARIHKRFHSFSEQWQSFSFGAYVMELVMRLTEEGVADQFIWDELLSVFDEFDQQAQWSQGGGVDRMYLQIVSRIFAIRLLNHLGYKPQLQQCLHCRESLNPKQLFFSVLHSGCLCERCEGGYPERVELDQNVVKFLRLTMESSVSESAKLALPQESLMASSRLIDQLVAVQLQRPLRSVML